jgi:SAM-dependent methyltransferase
MSTPDAATLERYRAAMRKEWTEPEIAEAWRKWSGPREALALEVNKAMMKLAEVRAGQKVLDIASGAGQPAIPIAEAVAPSGHVTATDLSAALLGIAEENARALGLQNMSFRLADAEALPFPNDSFDTITCRCGLMFVPDHLKALRECRRVLKPGGRAVFAVWGAREQPMFATTVGILRKFVDIPAPEPGAPNAFKFAEPGTLRAALLEAAFARAEEELREIAGNWPGPPEQFWDYFRESAAPFRPYVESLSPSAYEQLKGEVAAALGKYYDGRQLRLPLGVILAKGLRD